MRELPDRLVDLQAQLRAGEWTIADSLQAQRTRMAERAPALGCVTALWPDTDPVQDGPLRGVALAHKDIFDLPARAPGLGVTRGRADPARQRAAALARLAQSGAHQSAALAMAAHACGATAQNPHLPRAINPLNPAWAVGGSSSGSAVAVAAGLTYFSLGTDTAGSVRIPAATCGLWGLKTTHGLIDTTGCAPLAPSLDSIGVLARHADDVREALRCLAPDLDDAPVPQGAPRLRCWLPPADIDAPVHADLQAWASAQGATAVDLGGIVHTLTLHAQRVLCFEVAQTHHAELCAGRADPGVQALGWTGLVMPRAWYDDACAVRGAWLAHFVQTALADADALVLPALPCSVPDWDEVHTDQPRFAAPKLLALHRFMGFVNYLGLPALSMPIGTDRQGRPLSVQLVARPHAEHRLLQMAQRLSPLSKHD